MVILTPGPSFSNTCTRVTVFLNWSRSGLVILTPGPSFSNTCTRVTVFLTGPGPAW